MGTLKNNGRITILSLILSGLALAGLIAGMMGYIGGAGNQPAYNSNIGNYQNDPAVEAQDAINQTGNISSQLEGSMKGTTITGINIIDQIFGGLFVSFRNLLTTVPDIFTGILTTSADIIGLPGWTVSIITTAITAVIVFIVARLVFKGGRLGG